ncbi:unnamed protein product [Caenorhabditis nigoni]
MDSPVDPTQDVATTWNSNHPLDLDSGGNSVSNSPMNLNSVPSKSYLPAHMTRQKRNLPKNSDAPVYGLVPDGLAPKGWRNDPAWQQNVYKIGETIQYQGNDYQMAKTWTELWK